MAPFLVDAIICAFKMGLLNLQIKAIHGAKLISILLYFTVTRASVIWSQGVSVGEQNLHGN